MLLSWLPHATTLCRFTTCLDASKTGLRVKSHVFEEDRRQSMKGKPHYMAALEKSDSRKEDRGISKRKGTPFILDVLVDEGHRLRDEFLKQYSSIRNTTRMPDRDEALTFPYLSASRRATQAAQAGQVGHQWLQETLTAVKHHVQKAHADWQAAIAIPKTTSKVKGVPDHKERQIQRAVQFFAQRPVFEGVLPFSDEELKTIKASYAYWHSTTFGFSVAFAELCAIKARAQGSVLFADRFAEVMNISNTVLRALSQAQDDIDD